MSILSRAKGLIWSKGFDWGIRHGYKDLRDNRIIAMAFEAGWKAGRRKATKEKRPWKW